MIKGDCNSQNDLDPLDTLYLIRDKESYMSCT